MNIKISNRKELQLKALVDFGCTHTRIYKQLMKKERIKIEPINRLFEVFNINGTKSGEFTQFTLLKLEINKHITDLNSIDMFLGYNWLVKHNLEVNWNLEII